MKDKDCESCDYFEGYDEDGNIECCVEDEGECPRNEDKPEVDGVKVEEPEVSVTINMPKIKHHIADSIKDRIDTNINYAINSLIKSSYSDIIKKKVDSYIDEVLKAKVDEFMEEKITIGGGWEDPKKEVTRNEYLSCRVAEKLEKNFDKNKLDEQITSEVKKSILNFASSMKSDINKSVGDMFTQATRATLTENVVQLLMDNDTYKKLSNSMKTLLGE